jgi:hypothetical protein
MAIGSAVCQRGRKLDPGRPKVRARCRAVTKPVKIAGSWGCAPSSGGRRSIVKPRRLVVSVARCVRHGLRQGHLASGRYGPVTDLRPELPSGKVPCPLAWWR